MWSIWLMIRWWLGYCRLAVCFADDPVMPGGGFKKAGGIFGDAWQKLQNSGAGVVLMFVEDGWCRLDSFRRGCSNDQHLSPVTRFSQDHPDSSHCCCCVVLYDRPSTQQLNLLSTPTALRKQKTSHLRLCSDLYFLQILNSL